MTSDRVNLFPQAARGLQYAADLLQNPNSLGATSAQVAGYNLASNILLPFAIEVALKGLIEQHQRATTTSEPAKVTGHDLINLFDRLPDGIQTRIGERWSHRMRLSGGDLMKWPSVRHFLAPHRNSFESWRYLQTGAAPIFYTPAQCLISAIIDEIKVVDTSDMSFAHAREVLAAEAVRLRTEATEHQSKAHKAEEPLREGLASGDSAVAFNPQWGDVRGHQQSAAALTRKAHLLHDLATDVLLAWWNRREPEPGTLLICNRMRALEDLLSEEWLDPEVRKAAETVAERINDAIRDRGFRRDSPGGYVQA